MRYAAWIAFLLALASVGAGAETKLSSAEKKAAVEQRIVELESNATARAKVETGQYRDALEIVNQVRRSNPVYTEMETIRLRALAGLAMRNRIDRLLEQGREAYLNSLFDLAKEYYEDAIELDPDQEEARKQIELCDVAIRVKTGQPLDGAKNETPEIRLHGYTVAVTEASQDEAEALKSLLGGLEQVRAARLLDLCGGVAIIRILGTPLLTTGQLEEALRASAAPRVMVEKSEENFVVAHIEDPRWMKGQLGLEESR